MDNNDRIHELIQAFHVVENSGLNVAFQLAKPRTFMVVELNFFVFQTNVFTKQTKIIGKKCKNT